MNELLKKIECSLHLKKRGYGCHHIKIIFKKKIYLNYTHKEKLLCATFARKLNLPLIATKILFSTSLKNPKEILEYALCLSLLGAKKEALSLLKKIDPKKYPLSIFYSACICMSQWNHKEAIKNLIHLKENYFEKFSFTEKQNIYVSLATCYLAENRLKEAKITLSAALNSPHPSKKNTHIHAHTAQQLELLALYYLKQKNGAAAKQIIEESKKYISTEKKIFGLYQDQWNALLYLHQTEEPILDRLEKIQKLKLKAWKLQEWEMIRNLDFHYVQHYPEPYLIHKLYFGTASDYFKKRFLQNLKKFPIKIEPIFYFDFSWASLFRVENELNALSLKYKKRNFKIISTQVSKPGALLDRLLKLFISDFYRPFSIAEIHEWLFPDQSFHPYSSPVLIRQNIKRLRQELRKIKSPFHIAHSKNGYRLHGKKNMFLEIFLDPPLQTQKWMEPKKYYKIIKIKKKFNQNLFSCVELSRLMNESVRSSSRTLSDGIKNQWIQRHKKGRQIIYSLLI